MTAVDTRPSEVPPRVRRSALPAARLLTVLALGALVLPPLGVLATGAFSSAAPGEAGTGFDLGGFVAVFSDPRTGRIVGATLIIALGVALLSAVAGFLLGWLVTRTDLPFRRAFSLGIVLPFFIPGSVSAVAWAGLANPTNGTITGLLRTVGIEIDVYSIAGIVLVEAAYGMPLVFIAVVTALENIDANLEEAGYTHGARPWRATTRITLPLVLPSLLGMTGLLFLRMLAAFEVPYILGTPARIEVFSSAIYTAIYQTAPARYDIASAMSVLLIATTLLLLVLFRRQLRSGTTSRATVRGKGFAARLTPLGPLRPLWALLVGLYIAVAAVLPLGYLLLGALSGTGRPDGPSTWSLSTVTHVLSTGPALDGLVTTLELSLLVGVVTAALAMAAVYIARRSGRAVATLLDGLVAAPIAIPGAVLGLALLWTWLPIQYPVDLYGSVTLLVLGYTLVALPVAGRLLAGTDSQVHPELEEAALVHGSGLGRTFLRVYLPVMASGAVAAFFLSSMYVPKEAAVAAMLVTSDTATLPALILAYWRSGDSPAVMVMSLLLVACVLVLWAVQAVLRRIVRPTR